MASQAHRYVGLDTVHENSRAQVCGEPAYVDDVPAARDALQVHIVGSPVAAGKLIKLDLKKVREHKGVDAVFDAGDIPGSNCIAESIEDEPVFAEQQILHYGQPLFAVAARTIDMARAAAKLAVIKIKADDEPVITIGQAASKKRRLSADVVLKKGRSDPAIKNSEHSLTGNFSIAGQDHFYLEPQVALCVPQETGQLRVFSSTQNVFQLQAAIIKSVKNKDIVVESLRVGGSFGGKLTQSIRWAIVSALVANETKKPAIVRLDRSSDMIMTGKRHDFEVAYRVGFDKQGVIKGLEITLASRCGCTNDMSAQVNDYAVLHLDNAYYLKNFTVTSSRYQTNTVSNTVFRGSGRPQGILAIERIIDEIAARLAIDPLKVRLNNLYGESTGSITHYGMRVEDQAMSSIINELKRTSTYLKRKKAITEFNASSPVIKRGIAFTPVKMGVASGKLSDGAQAPVVINIENNGRIHVWTSSVEAGQGLYIKLTQIVAEVFQVDPSKITVHPPRSDMFARFDETTGSSSVDLNGQAAQQASEILKQRLMNFAIKAYEQPVQKIKFTPEGIKIGRKTVQFKTLVAQACGQDLNLSAEGCFAAEINTWNLKKATGRPFNDFINGACVAEVAVDSLTGESQVIRADILQDCGRSINAAIDTGQVEGGFAQGMGWILMEELLWNSKGELVTTGPSSYKIPVSSNIPDQFHVRLFKHGKSTEHGIFGTKVVGELPLILAISVYSAILQAVASIKNERGSALPDINIPATPERILMAIHDYTEPQ